MKEEGIVEKIENSSLVIKTVPHKECKGCKTCGAGRSRSIALDQRFEELKEGDKVEIEIDPSVMLKLYMFLYATPLLAFVLALLITYGALKEPISSAVIGIIFTGITYFLVGRYIKRKKEFSPKITKREEI